MKRRPVVGVTLGDPAGIGPEIIARAAAAGVFREAAHTVVFADEPEWKRGLQTAGVQADYVVVHDIGAALAADRTAVLDVVDFDTSALPLGVPSVAGGKNSVLKLEKAVRLMMDGCLDAVCFGPNNKEMMKKAGYNIHGAIDLIAGFMSYTGHKGELNVQDNVWTARVTSHIPLMEVTENLSVPKILATIRLLDSSRKTAGTARPHIAVAALNPHAGEGGTCGREEIDLIQPAIDLALKEGIFVVDHPVPADTLFYNLFRGEYDSAVTMFHDQGQIALKLKGFDLGTTVFGGLPMPVTTCGHGTAYDVAGKGLANPGAWTGAYRLACAMAQHRLKTP